MAGKIQTKNVYVDTEYDNIIIIDPNLIREADGSPSKRLVDHEDLVYYANLETKVVPRTKFAAGEDLELVNTGIASFIGGNSNESLNFLQPKKNLGENERNYFDTSWSDQLTGKGSRNQQGANQTVSNTSFNNVTDALGNKTIKEKTTRTVANYKDTQTLGIKSIKVTVNAAGVPSVDMTLVDIQGRTLFEQGENSLYSVFFNLPYPAFYLTLKGYYGKAIRYQLALISFNAKLDSSNGNFDISLKLIGRPSALLFDTLLTYGKTLPKMYKKEIVQNGKVITSDQVGTGSQGQRNVDYSLGRQYLESTYAYYESKGLIPEGFPRLGIEDFTMKVENFNKWLKQETGKGNFGVLSDVYKFRTDLLGLKTEVYDLAISKYLDLNNPFVINDEIYYPFLSGINETTQKAFNSQVRSAITQYKADLEANPSFGNGGVIQIYKDPSGVNSTPTRIGEIKITIDDDIIQERDFSTAPLTQKDYEQTYTQRFGKNPSENPNEFGEFVINLTNQIQAVGYKIENGKLVSKPFYFYKYGTKDKFGNLLVETPKPGFLKKWKDINAELDIKEIEIEEELGTFIAKTASVDTTNGLGFVPSIRNIFAVLFAGVDSFYRLMDKTHRDAWNLRENAKRLETIQEGKSKFIGNDRIIYPWPLYYAEEFDSKNNKKSYVVQYIGDPKYTSLTNGTNYTVWPEVEFTEEFLTGMASKLVSKPSNAGNPTTVVKKNQINSIYNKDFAYPTNTTANFLTEFLERSYINAHYGKFNSDKLQNIIKIQMADLEGENIKESVNGDFEIIDFFQNQVKNASDFYTFMERTFPNSTWFRYKNNIFSTNYLVNQLSTGGTQTILSTDYISSITVDTTADLRDKVSEYLEDTISNEKSLLDLYPFTENSWMIKNMGNSVVGGFKETTKIYTIEDNIEKIIRDDKDKNGNAINLFTNFRVFVNGLNSISNPTNGGEVAVKDAQSLKQFFDNRVTDVEQRDFFLTESVINYGASYSGQVQTKKQTNTILNTPYFVNAISKGVELEKISGDTPYATLGYLFLNSLPLITTRERLKNRASGEEEDVDYLSTSFNKISAYHKLPYAWVLKYGSIWHRYKRYVEDQVDILDDVWKDLDYAKNYDPITNNKTKTYQLKLTSLTGTSSVMLQNIITPPIPLSNTNNYNVGFYPKIINDVYYYFSKKDLFVDPTTKKFDVTDATILSAQNDKNLEINKNSKSSYLIAPLDVNGNQQYLVNTFYSTMKVNGNTDLPFYTEDLTLLFPSMGSFGINFTGNTSFNQSLFECFDDQKKNKISLTDNPAFYNGTVRSLWKGPNFGYFDNSNIKKPQPYEYMKKVKTLVEIQSSYDLLNYDEDYSTIEEIFGIFNKETLDLFEKYFLLFVSPVASNEGIVLENELFGATLESPPVNIPVESRRLFYYMKSLFCVEQIGSDYTNKQMETFTSNIFGLLAENVLFRNGNPGNFNRKLFNDFSESTNYATQAEFLKTTPDPYLNNLPPSITIQTSKSSYPDEWKTLQLYVGFSTINNMSYSAQSYITDFFSDNNIGFNENNIIKYAPLIKLYATYKLDDPTFNNIKFKTIILDFLNSTQKYQDDMITETIRYLKKNLPSVTPVSAVNPISTVSGNVIKLETYSTLKTLNDKWIAGSDFQTKTLFEDFLFMDRANNDIGDKFTIDLFAVKSLIENNDKATMMDTVSKILGDNNFIFFAMPAYINFYNLQKSVRDNEEIPYDIPNSLFGTYLNVDYINSKPKFLCMYTGKGSENLSSDAEFNKFDSDSMDLTKPAQQTVSSSNVNLDKEKSNVLVGFNVDFGIQHQNIFKDLSLDMSENKNTAETFKIQSQIANSASGDKVAQQSTSLYSIYRTRSYTCSVNSMGNVMIQPTMYFNLRHVPLFRGAYWIQEVSHDINDKEFKTDFKGIRMPIFSFPDPDSYTASINKSLVERIKPDAIATGTTNWPMGAGFKRDPDATLNNTPLKSTEQECKDNLNAAYSTYSGIPAETRIISGDDLKNKLSAYTVNLKALLYGTAMRNPSNRRNGDNQEQISTFNYNIFGFDLKNKYGGSIATAYLNASYACVAIENITTPIVNFKSYKQCIEMANALYGTWIAIIPDVAALSTETTPERKTADALARFYITLIENKWTKNTAPTKNDIYNNSDVIQTTQAYGPDQPNGALDVYIDVFEYALKKVS